MKSQNLMGLFSKFFGLHQKNNRSRILAILFLGVFFFFTTATNFLGGGVNSTEELEHRNTSHRAQDLFIPLQTPQIVDQWNGNWIINGKQVKIKMDGEGRYSGQVSGFSISLMPLEGEPDIANAIFCFSECYSTMLIFDGDRFSSVIGGLEAIRDG